MISHWKKTTKTVEQLLRKYARCRYVMIVTLYEDDVFYGKIVNVPSKVQSRTAKGFMRERRLLYILL